MATAARLAKLVLPLALLAVTVDVSAAEPPAKHSFAIYRADGIDRRFIFHGTGDWHDAKLIEPPLVTDVDVVSYDILRHALTVTPEAMARLPKPPVEGTPFVVVADGEPIYAGVFVTCLSSMSFAVPAVWVDRRAIFPDEPANTFIIGRAYPSLQFGVGPDPRSDKRIVAALTALGKLVSRGPQVDEALTQKIGQILNEVHPIQPGVSREELLRVFTTEGGLSTTTQRTYVYRRCPYIKVDAEFTLTEPNQRDERPTDKVRRVSRPYLQWSIND